MRRGCRRALKRAEKEVSESSWAWQRNCCYAAVSLSSRRWCARRHEEHGRARSYVVCAIQREERVGAQHLAAGGEGMADLEQGGYAEALVELGAQAGEGLVGEEDVALDLLGDLVDCAGVGQSEQRSPVLEGVVCGEEGVEHGIGALRGQCCWDGGDFIDGGGDDQDRLFHGDGRHRGRSGLECVSRRGEGLSLLGVWRDGGRGLMRMLLVAMLQMLVLCCSILSQMLPHL